jgi:catechol 2,3-dioxygenase-like lactoylglutathione lyase family enzyme
MHVIFNDKGEPMNVSSMYPVIGTQQLEATKAFYMNFFEFQPTFEADWYISLIREQNSAQLAILDYTHPSVPEGFRNPAQGVLINFEVDDVDAVHAAIVAAGLPVHLSLRDEAWGQRHFITADPAGLLVDVITLIPPSGDYVEQYTDLSEPILRKDG